MLRIDPSARVSPLADIEQSIKGTAITIGANTTVDAFVKVKPAGGSGNLVIGDNVYINSGCVFYTGNGIDIGNDVLIAANCTFAATSHEFQDRSRLIREQGFLVSKGGIKIESDVWIGANVVILDGTILREGSVIGAGSVVRGEVSAYSVNAGNPLKLIRMRQ